MTFLNGTFAIDSFLKHHHQEAAWYVATTIVFGAVSVWLRRAGQKPPP